MGENTNFCADIFCRYIEDEGKCDWNKAFYHNENNTVTIQEFIDKLVLFNKYFGSGELNEILNSLELEYKNNKKISNEEGSNISNLIDIMFDDGIFTDNFFIQLDHNWAGEGDNNYSYYTIKISAYSTLSKIKKILKNKKITKKELDIMSINYKGIL